jgi:FlaA1/EpsC-like NDP-sugar epimerase
MTLNILEIVRRRNSLFTNDKQNFNDEILSEVNCSKFLVLGGAGSIGQAVTKEIFKRNPQKLHVVDISENNLVELVRDIRSSFGYIEGDFQTFALDIGSWQFDHYLKKNGEFDYVLNLTALKHVRSEKDPFTLLRMIETNILMTIKVSNWAKNNGVKKYFSVSTDKAANPVNMMGASKRIMELFLFRESKQISISMARFANVAFSDGSLLHGFKQRIEKRQPIVAPNDVKRYFVSPEESGLICLFSTIFGNECDVFFPKLDDSHFQKFSDIAVRFLESQGLQPFLVNSEDEAREFIKNNSKSNLWPCLFTRSDTTGEKDYEEFFTDKEELDLSTFQDFGIVKSTLDYDGKKLNKFLDTIKIYKSTGDYTKADILNLFQDLLPEFHHEEKGKYLDSKM